MSKTIYWSFNVPEREGYYWYCTNRGTNIIKIIKNAKDSTKLGVYKRQFNESIKDGIDRYYKFYSVYDLQARWSEQIEEPLIWSEETPDYPGLHWAFYRGEAQILLLYRNPKLKQQIGIYYESEFRPVHYLNAEWGGLIRAPKERKYKDRGLP